ncbi:LuxR C-terminal-related transcriptional regulator [Solwaraspora sp. WMMD406]|uniref:LuxR C-terminal-related transcriptional regulator n=1 Tax=Solwaraspora sp. WMMD406 TaxID=3016095 RepID=UPI002417BCFE|nr:LuxR C-terminal-related transcriptional regulator [Solwaraspora sp. WMMD406]MDG4766411.1 LuxR C-terminal-related transcriptional regulator [Solwaraspora sp. WMMD406]
MSESPVIPGPRLSRQETEVLLAYVSGLTMVAVARRVGIGLGTAKQYLERVKRKYEADGRPARTKLDLARRAVEDGLLPWAERRRPQPHG